MRSREHGSKTLRKWEDLNEFGFAPGFVFTSKSTNSLTRNGCDSRKEDALPPEAVVTGIEKAMNATSETKSESGLGETIRVVIHALLIALVIRTFLFQPFNIPSGSMKATLLVGDYLFVSKYSYGYTHYSIPFSPPIFSGRIFGREPNRGDILVFRLPKDDSTDYIKRVIGLPGDKIQMVDGVLHINGKAISASG